MNVGGSPVHVRLTNQISVLARSLVDVFVESIPIYGQLPHEELESDIIPIVEKNLEIIAAALRNGAPPSDEDLSEPYASAARRAQEGVPLDAVLRAYHTGVRLTADALFADATPDDLGDVLAAHQLLFKYLQSVTAAVSASYLQERESVLTQQQHAQHSLVSALLRGESPALVAAQAGVAVATRYLVVSVRIGEHPDEDQVGAGAAIASRRKLHRLREELERSAGGRVLSVLDPAGGLILLPVDDDPTAAGSSWDCEAAAKLAGRLRTAAGVDLIAAAEFASPEGVAAAATLTREVLDVVRAFKRPPGIYRLGDVLLEYQLTRPGVAMCSLAALLDPLADDPDLLRTLDAYLEHGLDRRHTAALLHVHPNTVDYRLRKATRLTGLNPADPADLQRIGAALAVRRFKSYHSPESE